MKKNRIRVFKNIISVVVLVFMVLSMVSNVRTNAEETDDPCPLAPADAICHKGQDITKTNYEQLSFETGKIQPGSIKRHNGDQDDIKDDSSYDMQPGVPYTVTYPAALKYTPDNNKMLTVEVSATLEALPYGKAKVYIQDNLLRVGWVYNAHGAKVNWSVRFIDPETEDDYPVHLLLGIHDPDESHYLINNVTGMNLYFLDGASSNPGKVSGTAAENYLVKSDGLKRLVPKGQEIIDTSTYREDPDGFNRAKFFVELNDETSFEMTSETFIGGSLALPYFYSINYQIKYDPNAETVASTVTGTMANQNAQEGDNKLTTNAYKAPGYTFEGWSLTSGKQDVVYGDEGTLVLQESDFGDDYIVRTLYAQWKPIEYKLQYDPNTGYVEGNPVEHFVDGKMNPNPQVVTMGNNDLQENKYESKGYTFEGWNTKEDGTGTPYTNKYDVTAAKIEDKDPEKPIDTLYAQWKPKEYKIIYKPNDTDLKASVKNPDAMEDDKFDVVNNNPDKWNSDDHPWPYQIDGYTFVGYKIENTGDTINNPQDFKGYLLNEDHQEVKLYAQWEPWKYYIHYDGNGADNMNAMPSQTFEYFDESMMSKKNAFSRDGYRFDGFRVEVNGSVKIVWSPEEFEEILKELGPGSSVTLKAMWEKLPVRFQAPVTGVE